MSNVNGNGPPRIRKWYERTGTPIEVFSESLTHQEFLDESNINRILAKYRLSGTVPQVAGEPMFGDFANLPEYQDALQLVVDARDAFEALPSHVRSRFENDPAKFVDFMSNPDNLDEAISLGLAPKKEVEIIPPDPSPSGGDGGNPPSEAEGGGAA